MVEFTHFFTHSLAKLPVLATNIFDTDVPWVEAPLPLSPPIRIQEQAF